MIWMVINLFFLLSLLSNILNDILIINTSNYFKTDEKEYLTIKSKKIKSEYNKGN